MTPEHIELARHALGLTGSRKQSYRNHFVCGPGHDDYAAWCEMVDNLDAGVNRKAKHTGGDPVFYLTIGGATRALRRGESLCPEDFPSPQEAGAPHE